MNYLLIAATVKEIEPFLAFYKKFDKELSVDFLIAGIGLTTTAYRLTKQLQLKKYDFVLQAGVAGCFNSKIPLGTVLAVKKDTIADQSVIELKKLKTLFDLKLVPQNQFPFNKGWLANPNKLLFEKIKVKSVTGISVNEISTSKQKINFYKTTFNPVLESMEGAALHFVCLMEKTPFMQIRSVSNYIGERNKNNWDMKKSIENLNETLIRFFKATKN